MARNGRAMLVLAALGGVAATLPAGRAESSARPCEAGNPDTRTLARSATARVYRWRHDLGHSVVGCLFKKDVRRRLDRPNGGSFTESHAPYVLAGRLAAY